MSLIYHYTSLDTLLKIIDKQQLHATDLRFCNDASETTYGRTEVADGLDEYAEKVRRERPAGPRGTTGVEADDLREEDDPNYWADVIHGVAGLIRSQADNNILWVLGVCFSRLPDALSQWRAYGQHGCAIGFEADINTIIKPIGDLDADLVELKYGAEGVADVVQLIGDKLNSLGTSGRADDNSGTYWATVRATASTNLLKHEGFREEEETRLTLSRIPGQGVDEVFRMLEHRVNASGLLVPYVAVDINLASIKEIRVGPGPHQRDNYRALDDLIRGQVYRDTAFRPELLLSQTPYR